MSFSDTECSVCEQTTVSENGYCAGCGSEVCPSCGVQADEFDGDDCLECGAEVHPNE